MKLFIMQFSPAPVILLLLLSCAIILYVLRRYIQLVISGRHIVTCVCIMMQVRILLSLTLSLCR